MRKYNFSEMGGIWCDFARKIVENGLFVANDGNNWDLWEYNGTVYCVPVAGSGCSASVWCSVQRLRRHLYSLMYTCNRDTLIPDDWENVNVDFLRKLRII